MATPNPTPWRERISGSDVIIAFVLSMVLGVLVFAAFASLNPDPLDNSATFSLVSSTTLYLGFNLTIVLVIGLMTHTESRRITPKSIGLRHVSAWWLFVGAALGSVCWTVASVTGAMYFWITGNALYTARGEFFPGLFEAPLPKLVFFWITVAILTALTNELLFRGILYTYLRRWSVGLAVPISAAAFGLLISGPNHPSLLANISVGAVLALIYERSGSLWPAVACAVAINTLGTFFGGPILF